MTGKGRKKGERKEGREGGRKGGREREGIKGDGNLDFIKRNLENRDTVWSVLFSDSNVIFWMLHFKIKNVETAECTERNIPETAGTIEDTSWFEKSQEEFFCSRGWRLTIHCSRRLKVPGKQVLFHYKEEYTQM